MLGVAYKDNSLVLLDMQSVYSEAEAAAIQSGRIQFRDGGSGSPYHMVNNFSTVLSGRNSQSDADSLLHYEILEGGFHSGKIAAIDIAT